MWSCGETREVRETYTPTYSSTHHLTSEFTSHVMSRTSHLSRHVTQSHCSTPKYTPTHPNPLQFTLWVHTFVTCHACLTSHGMWDVRWDAHMRREVHVAHFTSHFSRHDVRLEMWDVTHETRLITYETRDACSTFHIRREMHVANEVRRAHETRGACITHQTRGACSTWGETRTWDARCMYDTWDARCM